jgi:LysM repeat protein
MKSKISSIVKKSALVTAVAFLGTGYLFSDTTHVVQKGETLYSISKKYNSTIQSISEANKIDGTDIKVGQKLIIPGAASKTSVPSVTVSPSVKAAETYTVKKGDTWYSIARNFNTNVKNLYELNNAGADTGLKTGQKIKVPSSVTSAVASSPAGKKDTSPAASLPLPVVDTHTYSAKKGDSNLVWPVERPDVTYVNGKVSGVSLSAKKDESVNAIKAGTVMFSGSYRGFGNVVFIQSKTGHIYAYTGLGKILVSKGEYIDYKSQIGTAGIDSYSSKSQISLMVFQNGLPIDPAKAPRG